MASPSFNQAGAFLRNTYHALKFDCIDEFEGEIWKDTALDEMFDIRGEVAFWQPVPEAPEGKKTENS